MANSKATGKVVKNVPGMIYIIREIPDPEVATPVEGIASIKLGIVYGNDEAIKFRENQMKTGSSSRKYTLAAFPVDEDTEMPTPEGTKGGVYEMEQFLHSVFKLNGWKQVGEAKEWFAVPTSLVDMIRDIRKIREGVTKKSLRWTVCPELAKAFAYAPKHDDIPAFDECRRKKIKKGWKINTERNKDGRSELEERIDKDMPRKHDRDYMLRRGAVGKYDFQLKKYTFDIM